MHAAAPVQRERVIVTGDNRLDAPAVPRQPGQGVEVAATLAERHARVMHKEDRPQARGAFEDGAQPLELVDSDFAPDRARIDLGVQNDKAVGLLFNHRG